MSSKETPGNDLVGEALAKVAGVEAPPVDCWDVDNPRSLLSLVPKKWRQSFLDARFERPELFEMDERELYKKLRSEDKTPSPTVNTIRLKLWMEYERCHSGAAGRRIEVYRVVGEICRNYDFERLILKRPERAAWLMCAPTPYKMKIEEALHFGLDKLRDILSLDVIEESVDKSGKVRRRVNVKLGELQAKITNMLDIRINGAARQRIEQTTRQFNMNVNASLSDVAETSLDMTSEHLEARIKELEYRERKALNLPDIIPSTDAKPVEAEYAVVSDSSGGGSVSDESGS